MTDLDFDELDRAVNSLIAPTAAATKEPVTEKTVTLASTDDTASTPVVESQAPVSATEATPVSAPSLSARRSSGRFMDVVHPSSDMRTSSTFSALSSPAPRNVSPVSPQVITAAPVALTQPPAVAVEPAASPVLGKNEWPDPLEFHAAQHADTSTASVAPVVAPPAAPVPETLTDDDDIDKIANDINDSLKDASEEVLTSPFIADAKVDKRPLGAFSDETPATPAGAQDSNTTSIPSDSSSPALEEVGAPSPITPAVLPEELQSNLLSIEAADAPTIIQAPATSTIPAAIPEAELVPETPTPIGPTAITQQYQEEKSTGDQHSGAIFDTSSYHKPLSHPAKKKSGWLWIIWIILLVAIGGAVGAVVYFFVLPMFK